MDDDYTHIGTPPIVNFNNTKVFFSTRSTRRSGHTFQTVGHASFTCADPNKRRLCFRTRILYWLRGDAKASPACNVDEFRTFQEKQKNTASLRKITNASTYGSNLTFRIDLKIITVRA